MHVPLTFDTIRRVAFTCGCLGLFASLYMTWTFGYSISVAHGVGLAVTTIIAAIAAPAARFIRQRSGRVGGIAATLAAVFFVGCEFVGDLGYTFGMRDRQQVLAGAQTVAYTAVQDNLTSERENIRMWREQLADLKARNRAHADRNSGWLVSVDPRAMQEQMEALDLLISNEAARVRCAQRCEALKKQRADLAAAIANAKAENDLSGRIEATQRVIDAKVKTASTTKVGHSTAKAQNASFAHLALIATGDLEAAPDEKSAALVGIVIGLLMAVAATVLPTYCFWVAFCGDRDILPAPSTAGAPRAAVYALPSLTGTTVAQLRRLAA